MTDIVDLANAQRVLARCRTAGVRIVLYQGRLYAGHPGPTSDPRDGIFGWVPPPPKHVMQIDHHRSGIMAVLGHTGSARPWATEQLTGGCLLIFAPFGEHFRHRRTDRPSGPGAAA